MKNTVTFTKTFKRLYKMKQKKVPKSIFDRVNDAIKKLSEADRPDLLGVYKRGPLTGILAYELGNKNRLLYVIKYDEFRQKEIILLKVCSHKDVYNKG